MRDLFRAATAGLVLLAATASVATNAAAQAGNPTSPAPNDAAAPAAATAPRIALTPDQVQALRKSLENVAKQPAAPDLDSSVGASVPDSMTLSPLPPEAEQ